MARALRIQYPGAVYHVMARGNHGQAIYKDDEDRKHWLQILGEACEQTGWRVHAYVLMANMLGSVGLKPGQGKGYEAYLESRVLELATRTGKKDLESQWKSLRRGWYVGGKEFRQKLEGYLEVAVRGRQRESHSGGAKAAHDQAAAEQLLKRALRVLGLSAAQLQGLPKGAAEKAALAWWLRRRTTVSLRWVGQRLGMGHYTRVTQGVRRTERSVGRKLAGLRRKLEAAGSNGKA